MKEEEKLVTSNKLNRLFPEAANLFQEAPETAAVKNQIPIGNIEKISRDLERCVIPEDTSCSLTVVKIISFVESSKCLI